MLQNLDKQCGSLSNMPILSYLNSTVSIILFFSTVTINLLIVMALHTDRQLLSRNYYFIIYNIALADALMGLISEPLSVYYSFKEATHTHLPVVLKIIHFTVFVTNTVAILSMTVLTVDRYCVAMFPFYYYSKYTKSKMIATLLATWMISVSVSISYFFIGYIRFLAVFASSSVIITLIFMVVTMYMLRKQLEKTRNDEMERQNMNRSRNSSVIKVKWNSDGEIEFTQVDKKVTKTFLYMLLLYVLTYLPSLCLIIYLNVCENCNCSFIHIFRDVVFLSILSSALFRGMNFILCLEVIRKAIKRLATKRKLLVWKEMPLSDVN